LALGCETTYNSERASPNSKKQRITDTMRIELLLFLSFMVMIIVMVACSAPRRPTPSLSPTLFPAMTLTTYNPQMITRVGGDAAVAATISPPDAFHSHINISPPRCYRTASPMLTCLGTIRNVGQQAISDIILQASVIGSEGESIGQYAFSPEQRRVDADSTAAYRLRVPRSSDQTVALEIGLVGARQSAPAEVRLTLDDERGAYLAEQKQYQFSTVVRNVSGQTARDIRLIVTLEDVDDTVVGYRAADLTSELPSGESIDVDMTIAPLGAAAPVRHRASLEALPVAQP